LYNVFDLNGVHPARCCRRLPWIAPVLFHPLLSFGRHVSCHVVALVTIMIKEVDDGGACCSGERIPVLSIPGVPLSHHPDVVVVLVSLQERQCVMTGWPWMRRQGPRLRQATVLQPATLTTEWSTRSKHNTIKNGLRTCYFADATSSPIQQDGVTPSATLSMASCATVSDD